MAWDGGSIAWWVKVKDSVYGPYSLARLERFLTERRIGPKTLVADDKAGAFGPLRENAVLKTLLSQRATQTSTRVLVYAEVDARRRLAFEQILQTLGDPHPLGRALWTLTTSETAPTVRNRLSRILGRGNRLLVAEAGRGRCAWFNLPAAADARLRAGWSTAL
ncbi:MAG: hypothetical protein ACFB2Z_03740 [Maricaulaceae bacterium]